MQPNQPLTAGEARVMRQTFRQTMLRAADIIERVTAQDVVEMQARGLAEGMTLEQVSKIDRAALAAAHLRACVRVNIDKEGA